MNTTAAKLLALATACFLALPPGICAGFSLVRAAKVHAKKSCCKPCSPQPPADSEHKPSDQVKKCCCKNETPTPAASVQVTPDDALAHAIVILPAADHFTLIGGFESLLCRDTGPPLHVLQCVWRC